MVNGKNSEIEDELNNALEGGDAEQGGSDKAKKGKGAPRKALGTADGTQKTPRKGRGPCRPYKKYPQEKLDKLIEQLETRSETMDAKLRLLTVRLKAYNAEKSMREQDDD